MRAVLSLLAALVGLTASPALAAPRDGQMQQAINNTVGANLQRRGYELTGTPAQNTLARLQEAVDRLTAAGSAAPYATVSPSARTYRQLLNALGADIPAPVQVGSPFEGYANHGKTHPGAPHVCVDGRYPGASEPLWWCKGTFTPGGGSFGGAGAGGTLADGAAFNCGDVKVRLDAQGNLIIPAMPLKAGGPIYKNMPIWGYVPVEEGWTNWPSPPGVWHQSDSLHGITLRLVHLANVARGQKPIWYGAIGQTSANCIKVASVAYRDPSTNALHGRKESSVCSATGTYTPMGNVSGHPFDDKDCPDGGQSAGSFHPYGKNFDGGPPGHPHDCVLYAPNPTLGPGGYAINSETSIPFTAAWPNDLPEHMKHCGIDAGFLARVADALLKNAAAQPGYDGAPAAPITNEDSRPGDTKVDDLGDNPTTGSNPPPNGGVNEPPPTPPATGGGTDTCDFGPTGCTDPGTGEPSLGEAPTGIMDPIFNWLPDLPSITFDANNSECPIWAINMTEFGGPTWQFLLDDHCTLVEQQRGNIGLLMIALFGIGAALIILRA